VSSNFSQRGRLRPPLLGERAGVRVILQGRPWSSALLLSLSLLTAGLLTGCGGKNTHELVLYTSQDEVYAEPICQLFEQQTGVKVRAVFDSESVKTVGLVNRLMAESSNPQCDVFWNNEEFRTRQLAAHGIFRPANDWSKLGYRSRRIVINTNLLTPDKAFHLFSEATNAAWRGKVALAYPFFGTTATHFLALRQLWGDVAWQAWCRALVANKPFLVEGNSLVVRQVASGQAWIGFTDSDDVAAGQREGLPVAALPPTEETLFLPNTVGVLRGAPHAAEAQQFFEFLNKPEVSQRLVDAHALEGATFGAAESAKGLQVDWDGLLRDLDAATAEMKEIFLR
jgi:iron(III) transport system substrate-binding protein